MEKVQRIALKMIQGLKTMLFAVRSLALNLFGLLRKSIWYLHREKTNSKRLVCPAKKGITRTNGRKLRPNKCKFGGGGGVNIESK